MSKAECWRVLFLIFLISTVGGAQSGANVVVVTRGGDKLQGKLRSATTLQVLVDVANQTITLSTENIKYISFVGDLDGPAPTNGVVDRPSPMDQAFGALKTLRAAVEVGLDREQYSQKLLETLPMVNEVALAKSAEWLDVRLALARASDLYNKARSDWGKVLAGTNFTQLDWNAAASAAEYAEELFRSPEEQSHREQAVEAPIAVGETIKGRLGWGDTTMSKELDGSSEGSFNDVFRLDLASQTRIDVTLVTNACDPHLTLADDRGKKLDGDAGSIRRPSGIRRTLNPGRYFLWAGTYHAGEVCTYTLTVDRKAK